MMEVQGAIMSPQEKDMRFINPVDFIEKDYRAVYEKGEVFIGMPQGTDLIFQHLSRTNTVAVIGGQLGDEGKGRIVDNKIEELQQRVGVKKVNVVRYQGGANAGHTIGLPGGGKIALHQLPSGLLYEEAVGIMDNGMIIHMEDLQTEITEAEAKEEVGDLRGKLILSPEAMLCTDLDRAQEVLNRNLSGGKSKGGTGRGIAPTAADSLTRRGFKVGDLFKPDWEEKFAIAYDIHEAEFASHENSLTETLVPDLKETNLQKKVVNRPIGSKKEFLDRLASVRQWYIDRDATMPGDMQLLKNTFTIYEKDFYNLENGYVFEGAQAVGLDPNFGRKPDTTSTNTTIGGIAIGTGFPLWDKEHIEEKIAVAKLTYMSSVGEATMITDSGIEKRAYTNKEIDTIQDPNIKFAAWSRMEGNEFGTTTGRARDICFMDLPMLRYNTTAGGVEMIAGTHLDMAREDLPIRVCTHYVDLMGNYVPYQPGMEHQKNLTPNYIDLPGWDGKKAREATNVNELPDNAKKYLAFIQRAVGSPIVFVTTGPARENAMTINNYREV